MRLLVRVMGHSNLFKCFSDDNTITNHNYAAKFACSENHAYGTEDPYKSVTSTWVCTLGVLRPCRRSCHFSRWPSAAPEGGWRIPISEVGGRGDLGSGSLGAAPFQARKSRCYSNI
jgi:hypothetical protein